MIRPPWRSKVLAIALDARGAAIAHIHLANSHPRILQAARFDLPDSLTWDAPAPAVAALAQRLRDLALPRTSVVLGLPARWIVLRPRQLPPAAMPAVAQALRLVAEQDLGDPAAWSLDALAAPNSAGQAAFLAATPRPRLDALRNALRDAGYPPRAVLPTVAALHALTPPAAASVTLRITPDGADLLVAQGSQLRAADHLSPAELAEPAALPDRLIRTAAAAGVLAFTTRVWSAGQALELPPDAHRLNLTDLPGQPSPDRDADPGPVALALALDHQVPDFLSTRMQLPGRFQLTRTRLLATLAILAILALGLTEALDWTSRLSAARAAESDLADGRPRQDAARQTIARVQMARGWFDNRPPMLDQLHAVTLAFPNAGQAWATSLILREDLTGTLAGKAQDERAVLELMDHLRSSGRFHDVKLLYLRQAERNSRTASFAITFQFTGKE